MMPLSYACLFLLLMVQKIHADVNELGQEEYDIDSSWAIHSANLSDTFGADKQALYDNFMDGCRKSIPETDKSSCNDPYRIFMNTHQPPSMRNYTRLGFEKIRVPQRLFDRIREFWQANKDKQNTEWGKAINIYQNMWDVPPTFVSVHNTSLTGGGNGLKNDIWDTSKAILEEWTGQYLSHVSCYGIRVYHNESILTPHVDRNPLVASAIINVAQDVEEEWPLEVWGHDGKPYNITMEPGDMVLYESHSIIHGRPFPLRGNYYANVFVHYEVIGSKLPEGELYLDEQAKESRAAGLPPYIVPGSRWVDEWRKRNPNGWEMLYPIDVARAAERGDLEKLKIQAVVNKTKLFEGDENDWQPIHLAARAGHVEVVDFLLKIGANIDAVTNEGRGRSPLRIAQDTLGESHEVCGLLRDAGGHAMNMKENEL